MSRIQLGKREGKGPGQRVRKEGIASPGYQNCAGWWTVEYKEGDDEVWG